MDRLKITAFVAAVFWVAMLGVLQLAEADGILKARLRGFQEVPAISTQARGEFRANIGEDETSIEYELSYENLQGTITQAHIHFGQFSVNGGIVVFLCQTTSSPDPTGLAPTCLQSGQVTGTISGANIRPNTQAQGQGIANEEFAEVLRAMRAGVAYANIHTTLHSGGEIRGQIRRERGTSD